MPDQIEIARSIVCYCSRSKKVGHIFCKRCFPMLTEDAKHALYNASRRDFPAAYDRCVAQLQGAKRAPSPRYVKPKARGASAQRSWFGEES